MYDTHMQVQEVLLKIIRFGTYAALLTPLVVAPWFVFPFVLPKAIFFWVVAEILFAAWILLAILDKRFRPKENLLLWAVSFFLAVMLIASFRGIHASLSFWSTFERMGGMITLIHGFLFFLVLSSVFVRREDWTKFFLVAVFVGALVSGMSFMERFGMRFLPSARAGSTLGNSSFFGSYIIFPLFFSFFLFALQSSRRIGWRKACAASVAALMGFALARSNAQAALFASLGGVFFIFAAWLWGKAKILAIVLVALGLIAGSVIFYGTVAQNKAITKYLPYTFSAGGIGARRVAWDIAWQGIKERPILGFGPENFRAVFTAHYNPCLPIGEECGGEIWFDHAHNVVFDTLIAGGFAGLLGYLGIFLAALYLLWRKFFHEARVAWVITGLLLAYIVQDLFVFDMPATYLMFFFTLAFIAGSAGEKSEVQNQKENANIQKKPLVVSLSRIAVLCILFVSIFFFGFRPLLAANFAYRSFYTRLSKEERMRLYLASLAASPLGTEQTRQSFTNTMIEWLSKGNVFSKDILESAEVEAGKMVKENPASLLSYIILGNFYNAMVKSSVLQYKDQERARHYLTLAKDTLKKAVALSPTNQNGYLSLAQTYIFEKDFKKAEDLLKHAIDLEPRYADSHWNLGEAYMIAEDFEKSAKEYDTALALGYNPSGDIRKLANLGHSY
ncbi:MAG: O-antigen ligase family protein, partial [Candidatus Spechtbacteria bacterium]|nr:O-antigen ligase family protein [Candidatus Spechtbacteria bacterium]